MQLLLHFGKGRPQVLSHAEARGSHLDQDGLDPAVDLREGAGAGREVSDEGSEVYVFDGGGQQVSQDKRTQVHCRPASYGE